MRIYKSATIITGIMTILSFVGALIFNFCTLIDAFWCNALLGVFGSSLLTFLTSIIGYRVESRKTFEGFSYETKELLHIINKYQNSWDLEAKVDYFLYYHDVSKISWDRYYRDFSFVFDPQKKKIKYIYSTIYLPIEKINQLVNYHACHFRWYKDGSGRNDHVVSLFVQEIEALIIDVVEENIQKPDGDAVCLTSTKNKIVSTITSELNNKYYELMYGKRIYYKSRIAESDKVKE